jgi:hypothetical protein
LHDFYQQLLLGLSLTLGVCRQPALAAPAIHREKPCLIGLAREGDAAAFGDPVGYEKTIKPTSSRLLTILLNQYSKLIK